MTPLSLVRLIPKDLMLIFDLTVEWSSQDDPEQGRSVDVLDVSNNVV